MKKIISSDLRYIYLAVSGGFSIVGIATIIRVQIYQFQTTGGFNYSVSLFLIIAIFASMSFTKYKKLARIVEDEGDHLLVKKGKIEAKIYLTNIKHISCDHIGCVYLELIDESTFGKKIGFLQKQVSLLEHNIFNDLKERVYQTHTEGKK